jgi:hypothetical protein
MICRHLIDNSCSLASNIAKTKCSVNSEQCAYCTTKSDNPQAINIVTISLALLNSTDKASIAKQYASIIEETIIEGELVGTELRKQISWFVWNQKVSNCKTCKNREERMNRWGCDRCLQNIDIILEWLKESAKNHYYPYNEFLVKRLVMKAINNARKKP